MMLKWFGSIVVSLYAATAAAQTSVPQQLAYEGRLSALNGTPTTGTHSIKFAVWPSLTGGTSPLWSDTLSVTVVNGLYSVTLGTTTGDPIPPTLFDGTVRYLELTVDSDLLSPRQPIGSVPYSILSGGVQGGPVNATSYELNGNAFSNDAGRTLLSHTGDGGTLTRSVSGLFCGATPSASPYTGKITDPISGAVGYLATKLICQGICGSPTAHMCSGQELVSSEELGVSVPYASTMWYSTGGWSLQTSGTNVDDCRGWTAEDSSAAGLIWAGDYPNGTITCANPYQIACCD
jgi:hypothetical protein